MARTKLLPDPLLDRVKASPRLYRVGRRLRMRVGDHLPYRSVDGILGPVHPNDFMLNDTTREAASQYSAGAASVLKNVDAALSSTGKTRADIATWLDFGCGYGRVVRYLVETVPANQVFVTDILESAAAFCRDEFGVTAVSSSLPLSRRRLGEFDCVYAISVMTHLPEDDGREFLEFLSTNLAVDGIGVFTTHGPATLAALKLYGRRVPAKGPAIKAALLKDGFAYVPYEHSAAGDYGLAWHTEGRLRQLIQSTPGGRLKVRHYQPQGLDRHQDVWAVQRVL
jgi:SAM-dependent methyltransferase